MKQSAGKVLKDARRFVDVQSLFVAGSMVMGVIALTASTAAAQTPNQQPRLTPEWARAQEILALDGRRNAPPTPAPAPVRAAAPSANATSRLNAARPDAVHAAAGPVAFAETPPPALESDFAVATVSPAAGFGPTVEFRDDARPRSRTAQGGYAVIQRRDIWSESAGHSDRLRLTTRGGLGRADGAPLPPTGLDAADLDVDSYDVSFTRGWEAARGYTRSGLEVTLIPHAGVGVGDSGGTAEAGATLRIGSSMDEVAPKGSERFGDRARWYVYAAGSGRAVGYNFARNRDGDYARSGMSHDSGSFLGDASIGVAYRKGDLQSSFGVVYREIEAEGLRGGEGFDRDVAEGLIAFQLSIKPEF